MRRVIEFPLVQRLTFVAILLWAATVILALVINFPTITSILIGACVVVTLAGVFQWKAKKTKLRFQSSHWG